MTSSDLPLPPGALGLPFFGETMAWNKSPFGFIRDRVALHGETIFKTRILGKTVAFCVGPQAIEKFYDEQCIVREGATPGHVSGLIGAHTLPFVDGVKQKRNKRLLLSALSATPMAGYVAMMSPIVESHVSRWAKLGELTWFPLMESMVLSVFNTVFTGAEPDAENSALRADLDTFIPGILALPLPMGGFARAKKAKARLLDHIGAEVEKSQMSEGPHLIRKFIEARDSQGQAMTPEQIRDELLHVFFAGYGTMSTGLTFAAHALATHKEVYERARAEILEVCGDGEVTTEHLSQLHYVSQLWKEVMRFYPIVPHTLFGRVVKEFECYGYRVPVGWNATACMYASQHASEIFADSNRFDPDRFSETRREDTKHPYALVPQGGNPRDGHRCLGEDLSTITMKVFLVHLLRGYSIELLGRSDLDMNLFPPRIADGLRVCIRRAETHDAG